MMEKQPFRNTEKGQATVHWHLQYLSKSLLGRSFLVPWTGCHFFMQLAKTTSPGVQISARFSGFMLCCLVLLKKETGTSRVEKQIAVDGEFFSGRVTALMPQAGTRAFSI